MLSYKSFLQMLESITAATRPLPSTIQFANDAFAVGQKK